MPKETQTKEPKPILFRPSEAQEKYISGMIGQIESVDNKADAMKRIVNFAMINWNYVKQKAK